MAHKDAKVIAVSNQKGGVGKTSTVVNIAFGLARLQKRVLVIDSDHQGDATKCLGRKDYEKLPITLYDIYKTILEDNDFHKDDGILKHEEGVYFMPANLKLADTELSLVPAMNREKILSVYVDEVKSGYDYILIDCPPSLGMLTINAFVAADSVIIPVQAEYLPADAMAQLTKSIARVRRFQNPKLEVEGIVFTMVDERTNLAKLSIETIETHFGQHFHIFESKIPRSVRVAEQPAFGRSIYALDSDGNAAKAYRALSKEVYNRGRQIELERKHDIGIGGGAR